MTILAYYEKEDISVCMEQHIFMLCKPTKLLYVMNMKIHNKTIEKNQLGKNSHSSI